MGRFIRLSVGRSVEKIKNFKFQLTVQMKVLRVVVKSINMKVFRISASYRPSKCKEIAQRKEYSSLEMLGWPISDSYSGDHTRSALTIPGVYVLTLVILVFFEGIPNLNKVNVASIVYIMFKFFIV